MTSTPTRFEDFDAIGLATLVKEKQVSPLELVDDAIARIERFDGEVHAVIHRSFERAREHARVGAPGSTPDAPFHGVPFLLKDLMAQDTGQPSTYSTKLLGPWRADRDAELVRRYKRAGLIILGRTNTPEFGIYGVTEPAMHGPTRNPWNLGHTPGGSSGGSSAAVAARYVPVAHGGDGGGSIRIPASHTGLVGMKPTRARNPAGPFAGERWAGFVAEHVLTRTVRDSAAILDATYGADPGAPYEVRPPARPFLTEVEEGARGAGRRLRIAFTAEPLFGRSMHPECVEAVQRAAKLAASLGHEVVEAKPSFDKEALIRAYFTVIAASTNLAVRTASDFAKKKPSAKDFEGPTWLLKLIGDKLTAGEYAHALQTLQLAHREIAPFFATYDVLLTPTAARPPVPIGTFQPKPKERALLAALSAAPARRLLLLALETLGKTAVDATPNTMLFNMTGQPAVSLPLHWSADGLPVGTQWVARFGDEATLFGLAAELEVASPWGHKKPALIGQAVARPG